MNLLAPVLIVLGVAIPVTLARNGVAVRSLGIGVALYGLLGLVLFFTGFGDATPEAHATGDLGTYGTLGILFIISALFAGITLSILGIIRTMSSASKR